MPFEDGRGNAAGNHDLRGKGVCVRGNIQGVRVDVECARLQIGDARGGPTALGAAVENVDGVAVEREVGVRGTVKGARSGGCGIDAVDRDDAVDRKVQGLAVRGPDRRDGRSGGGELVGVQLDEAVDRIGVADHGEHDRVTLIDDDLKDVGENKFVAGPGGVVDHAELSGAFLSGVNVAEGWGNSQACGFGWKGAYRTAGSLRSIVDDSDVALCAGVDVARNLSGEVEDEVRKAGRVPSDGKGLGVLNVGAQVAEGVENLQAACGDAVARDRNHDAVGEQARRNRAIGEGELREFIRQKDVAMAGGETEGRKSDHKPEENLGADRLHEETSILQR